MFDRRGAFSRRRFGELAAGSILVALGGCTYSVAPTAEQEAAAKSLRSDGRVRLPPGQSLIQALRAMGGAPGDPNPANFRLKVHGEVRKELDIDFKELLAMPQVDQVCDVHCVTKWTLFDSRWRGVRLSHIADLAGVKDSARHIIFEAAEGYTANILLSEGLAPNVLIAHLHNDEPLAEENGTPVRSLVPDLYFWKSSKWLTGIRFSNEDEPGFWETRGYNNHADPWFEERYA